MINVVNGYYEDNYNNKWNCDSFTQKHAEECAKTLINCRNCSDCSDCRNCRNCSDCRNCSGCRNCNGCIDCRNCSGCRNCRNCSGCSGCSDFQSNPNRLILSNVGSRNGTTYIYWLCDRTEVMCGCFNGSLLAFEKAVIKTHEGNEHSQRYLQLINQAWLAMEI